MRDTLRSGRCHCRKMVPVALWVTWAILACLVASVQGNTDRPVVDLTPAQNAWLGEHHTIRVAFDGHFPPYSYLDSQGRIQGMAVDVVRRIADRLGLRLEISPLNVWKDLYPAAQRKEIDLVATMVHRPERDRWFVFTRPYIRKSLVVMTRIDDNRISRRSDLSGRRVAVVRDYQYVPRILADFPDIQPVYVDTMLDGLNAVALTKADAVVTFFGAGRFLQARYGIANLKFAAIYDQGGSSEAIAVRGDWPELAAIFDKALATLGAAELAALKRLWSTDEALMADIQADRFSAAAKAWFTVLAAVLGLTLIGFVGVYAWNRTLKQKVAAKTAALQTELAERARAEAALRNSEQRLQAILDNTTAVIYLKDRDGRYLMVNRQFEQLFNVDRRQLADKNDYDLFPAELAEHFRANDLKALERGAALQLDEQAPHDDGLHDYISIKFPLLDAAGQAYAVCGISTDITDRKRARAALEALTDELEQRVKDRTAELAEKADRLERINRALVDRELRMIELKNEIRRLKGLPEQGDLS